MRRMLMLGAAASAALGLATAASAAANGDFIRDAIKGDNSEIMLGRMAAHRATSPEVRAYGRQLMQDHNQGLRQAAFVAQRLGVPTPAGPSAEARMEQAKLSVLVGRNFDREFVRYMIRDHQKDIADFQQQANGEGPTARFARQTLPTLHRHLDMATRLAR